MSQSLTQKKGKETDEKVHCTVTMVKVISGNTQFHPVGNTRTQNGGKKKKKIPTLPSIAMMRSFVNKWDNPKTQREEGEGEMKE